MKWCAGSSTYIKGVTRNYTSSSKRGEPATTLTRVTTHPHQPFDASSATRALGLRCGLPVKEANIPSFLVGHSEKLKQVQYKRSTDLALSNTVRQESPNAQL